jgi:uncharacterized membrane protein HdeD (DUF308 family)
MARAMQHPPAIGARAMNHPSHFDRERRLYLGTIGGGLAALLVGLLLMSNPWAPPGTIAALFVVYVLTDAAASFYTAMRARQAGVWSGMLLLVGIIDLAAAAAILAMPGLGALRLVAGVRGIASGACDGVWPLRQKRNELLVLAGFATFALGAIILAWPGPGTVALPWLIGLEAMLSGALLVAGGASDLKRAASATMVAAADA